MICFKQEIIFVQGVNEKGFFGLRPTKAVGERESGGRKLMKPISELSRGVKPVF